MSSRCLLCWYRLWFCCIWSSCVSLGSRLNPRCSSQISGNHLSVSSLVRFQLVLVVFHEAESSFIFHHLVSIKSSFGRHLLTSHLVSVSGLTWKSTRNPELWVDSTVNGIFIHFWMIKVVLLMFLRWHLGFNSAPLSFSPGLFCLKSLGPSGSLRRIKRDVVSEGFMHECPVLCDAPTFLCRYLLACFHLPLSTTLVLHVILYSVHICIYYVDFNISHVRLFFFGHINSGSFITCFCRKAE